MTRALTAEVPRSVPFARVDIVPAAQQAALQALRSGWITMGPQTSEFERELASYLGASHVVAVATCTAAIEIAVRALRLPPGATVLTPSLTFCGAVAPIAGRPAPGPRRRGCGDAAADARVCRVSGAQGWAGLPR